MHLSFTTYHTIIVLCVSAALLWLLSKVMQVSLQQVFYPKSIIILLGATIACTLVSMLSQFSYQSGMNQITVQGLPRGFWQTITEGAGGTAKSFSLRLFTEDIICWFCLNSVVWFIFKAVVKGR